MRILILLSLFLVGCAGSVSKNQVEIAISLCKQNLGLSRIFISGKNFNVHCRNGAVFSRKTNE